MLTHAVPRTRVDVTQDVVLDSVVNTLIQGITLPGGAGLTPKTCYITIYPEVPLNTQDQLIITVSPEGGSFDESMFIGGEQNQVVEVSSVLVGIWSRYKTDREGRDREVLCDQVRGLYPIKGKVLRCLAGVDLQVNYPAGTGGTVSFLREFLRPTRAYAPQHDKESPYAGQIIQFSLSWDWNLTDTNFAIGPIIGP